MNLRKANINDIDLLFEWANDDDVRVSAINCEKIIRKNHEKWFKSKITDKESFIYILVDNKYEIGQIRYDKQGESYVIDYSIAKEYRKKGYGKKLVELGFNKLSEDVKKPICVKAKVKKNNLGSLSVFDNLSYILYDEEIIQTEEYYCYSKTSKKKSILIASEKSWNKNIIRELSSNFPDVQFLLVTKNKFLNSKFLNKVLPQKIFFPHWSYFIKEDIYENYECVVFHMTDLPYGRGGSPLQNLIKRGFEETKISALRVVKEIDAGGVYLKEGFSLLGTAEEIFIRANSLIMKMIDTMLSEDLKVKEQKGRPVFFKRRTPEMSEINEEVKEIKDLYNHIRMLDAEGYPKAFIETEFFKIEFSRASLKANETIISDVRIIKK